MQDHNFEEQVHRKLNDMQLHPSEGVWEKVEAQISRKKKRRRFVIWLPLLMALFTAGYYYFHPFAAVPAEKPDTSPPARHTTLQATGDQAAILPDNNRTSSHTQHPGREREKLTDKPTADKAVAKDNTVPDHVAVRQIPLRVTGKHGGQLVTANAVGGKSSAVNRKPVAVSNLRNSEQALAAPPPVAAGGTAETSTDNDLTLNTDIAVKPAFVHPEVVTGALINTANSIINREAFHSPPVKQHVHPAGWVWMVTAAYGKSGINNSVFSSWNGMQADALSNFSAPGTANAAGNPPPSAIRPGSAFSAGISVRRQLNRKLSWSAGLEYTQLSNHITTGKLINDTLMIRTANPASSQLLQQYYSTGTQQAYTNRMHFIELPLELNVRLTGLQHLPVYWNAGLSISRLIASNALQYQSGSQVYYRNNTLFSHTQWNVSTGFDVQLFASSRYPLLAGPQFRYGITRLYAAQANDNKHLFFYGVRAAIPIPRKVR